MGLSSLNFMDFSHPFNSSQVIVSEFLNLKKVFDIELARFSSLSLFEFVNMIEFSLVQCNFSEFRLDFFAGKNENWLDVEAK